VFKGFKPSAPIMVETAAGEVARLDLAAPRVGVEVPIPSLGRSA
jgi:hypothetical protein